MSILVLSAALLCPALSPVVMAQEGLSPIDYYVGLALEQNLSIRQSELAFDRATEARREARSDLLPTLDVTARYTQSGGGRSIEFPVGDLLNPVYGALNQITASAGGSDAFPQVENQSFKLLRSHEQETVARLSVPVYRPSARANVRVKRSLAEAHRASADNVRRQLIADVKISYLSIQKAQRLIEVLEASRNLVLENLRVSERLVANGKVTGDAVYRARADLSEIDQQLATAVSGREIVRLSLNALLNRPLSEPIRTMSLVELQASLSSTPTRTSDLQTLVRSGHQNREELLQLEASSRAIAAAIGVARAGYLPNLTVVADYGVQGTRYAFGDDQRFRQASVIMTWNLFNGFQTRSQVEQARIHWREMETRVDEVSQLIELQIEQASRNLALALQSSSVAKDRLIAAQNSFRLVRRRHEEGMASQVEFIDARTALTAADVNLALTQFDYLTRLVELERAAATNTL